MNSIERISATIAFQPADRVPVIAQILGHSAVISGHSLLDYVTSGELAAKCQIKALERYGYDAVFAIFDTCVEAEAAGAGLCYRPGFYPAVDTILSSQADLDPARLPDPERAGRMPEVLKALRIMRSEVGDQTLVVGGVMGPMTVTTQILGIENALYLAVDHPDRFERVMDYAVALITSFGKAQIDAGAHLPLIFDPSASPAVVPPGFYREFILPRQGKVFRAFKEHGAAANWLHIAGPALPILPFYKEIGVDIANIDYCVDPAKAREALPDTCLDGNIKSVSFIESTPAEIEREAENLLTIFAEKGGFILSSGCEIPPESNPQNIRVLTDVARKRACKEKQTAN